MPERVVDQIECEDDQGNEYTVIVFQMFRKTSTLKDGPTGERPGVKRAVLLDGSPVNVTDDEFNTFKIVSSDRIIRRVPD